MRSECQESEQTCHTCEMSIKRKEMRAHNCLRDMLAIVEKMEIEVRVRDIEIGRLKR